jgi:mannose-6-phosphate isomerase-like protein (cupin superfamily)
MPIPDQRYAVVQLDEIAPVACPCGRSRRALAAESAGAVSLHLVDISADAAPHFHDRLTEIYLVLEGEGAIEVDGRRVPVRAFSAVLIPPGCRHRAIGPMRLANIVLPAFDPADEHVCE